MRRSENADLGLTFVLDALQIIGAAVCGALATKPDLVGDGGAFPLAAALIVTVGIFLTRETLASRSA
jgi:preprotein translocase subunit SecY